MSGQMPAEWLTELAELVGKLQDADGRWAVVPSGQGQVSMTRAWPEETVDLIVIVGPGAAYASRYDPTGRELWTLEARPAQAVAAVLNLAPPDTPGAPDGSDHIPRPTGQWT